MKIIVNKGAGPGLWQRAGPGNVEISAAESSELIIQNFNHPRIYSARKKKRPNVRTVRSQYFVPRAERKEGCSCSMRAQARGSGGKG